MKFGLAANCKPPTENLYHYIHQQVPASLCYRVPCSCFCTGGVLALLLRQAAWQGRYIADFLFPLPVGEARRWELNGIKLDADAGCRQWPRPAKGPLPRYAVSLGIRIVDF